MGDRTAVAATIHACPPLCVGEVLEIFEDHGLTDNIEPEDGGETVTEDCRTLILGEVYSSRDIACGGARDIAEALIARAPEVAFTVFEDPTREWLGDVFMYVRELGQFHAACDVDGVPMLSQKLVLELEGEADEVRQKKLGALWVAAIEALPEGGVVKEPERLVLNWNRRHGEMDVIREDDGGDNVVIPGMTSVEAITEVLAERGLVQIGDWVQVDDGGQLWRCEAYRYAAAS